MMKKVKDFLKRIIARILYYFPRNVAHKIFYYIIMKKKLNLTFPIDFNEKIQYLIVYSYGKREADLADKYKVRSYVSKKGYDDLLPKLYGVYNDVDDIKIDDYPEKFVLKTNNGCGGVILCNDKKNFDFDRAKKILKKNMKTNFSMKSLEYHYQLIESKIICEEYIDDKHGKQPIDYKFYCFDGKVDCILVCSDREHNLRLDYYDTNWNYLEYAKLNFRNKKKIVKPRNLKQMIKIAEELSEGFMFVRVDLYNCNGKIYFGELTFTPASGLIKYNTEDALQRFGNLLKLGDFNEK